MTAKPLTDEARLYAAAGRLTAELNDRNVIDLDLRLEDVLVALGRAKLVLEPDRGRRLARRVIATRTDL